MLQVLLVLIKKSVAYNQAEAQIRRSLRTCWGQLGLLLFHSASLSLTPLFPSPSLSLSSPPSLSLLDTAPCSHIKGYIRFGLIDNIICSSFRNHLSAACFLR